ncbi:MAG: hypothetical protein LBU65_01920 [Planctomycetaceae bacterium]|jgi:hypothetical protein|nr:hypothetical protein [Planctomycetaceae bacterium]
MMLFTALIIGLSVAAFAYFWNYIREVLNNPVREMLQKHYGTGVEQWFVGFIMALDEVMVNVRRGTKVIAGWTKEQLRGAWLWFGETFLDIDTTYIKIDDTHLLSETKSIMRLNEKDAVVRTEETIIRVDDLPNDIKNEMQRQNTNRYSVDEKKVVERQYKEKLELLNN